jgi:hypothetical protein
MICSHSGDSFQKATEKLIKYIDKADNFFDILTQNSKEKAIIELIKTKKIDEKILQIDSFLKGI